MKGKDHWGDLDIIEKVMWKLVLKYISCDGVNWSNLHQNRIQCEGGNEPSSSIKDWEFLDQLSDFQYELCSMEWLSCVLELQF
jgi:hypothetical protein